MHDWQGNLGTIEEVNKWIDQFAKNYKSYSYHPKEIFKVDLTKMGWLSPAGCTVLISTLDFLNEHFILEIKVPENEEIISYMERMNFFKTCNIAIKQQFDLKINMEQYYKRVRNNTEYNLFEITKLLVPDDVDVFYYKIIKILRDKSLPRERVADIASILSELANNALEHAGSAPYVCIQYYEGSSTVSIAIGDTGLGIYNSLKNVCSPFLTSHSVIKKAILTTASRYPNENRGKGLVDVTTRAYNFNNVKFYLRTHNSSYIIKEDDLVLLSQSDYFVGTYFYLTIQTCS